MDTAILRSRILDLAIRGQLVPQDPNEGTADDLLKTIATQRGKAITPITDNVPFDIPANWRWVKLGDMGIYRKGPFGSSLTKSMFVPKSDTTYKVYEQKNAINKNAEIGTYYISAEKYEEMKGFSVSPNDIIVSCAGTIGETFVIPQDAPKGIINQALMRVRLFDLAVMDYWLLYFDFVLRKESQNQSKGTAIKNIPPFEIFKQLPLPLPPLAEQHRIVAKVEELLSEVDKIEQAQADITQAATILRSRVLDMAFSGALTKSDIALWNVDTLHQACLSINAGGDRPLVCKDDPTENCNIPIYSNGVENQGLYGYTNEAKCIKPCITISARGTIGYPFIRETPFVPIVRLITAVPNPEKLDLRYLYYYILHLRPQSTGTSTPQLTVPDCKAISIPLPPLAEQHRIVAKIEQLFTEIDKLVK